MLAMNLDGYRNLCRLVSAGFTEGFYHKPRVDKELLRELNKNEGVTIISATHDYKMVDVSDRVVWIRDGKIAKIEERADIKLNVGEMQGVE